MPGVTNLGYVNHKELLTSTGIITRRLKMGTTPNDTTPMGRTIRIDGELHEFLKQKAIELDMVFASPGNLLRVLLGLDTQGRKQS